MMQQNARLSGRIAWELRTRSGLILEHGEQSNLITNSGLDQFGISPSSPSQNYVLGSGMRHESLLGDGSAAPANADLALSGTLISSTANPGGYGSQIAQTITSDAPNNRIRIVSTTVHLHSFTSAVNIREFGYRANGAGNLAIRELIRNVSNNPITLSINGTPAEPLELVIKHTMTIDLNWTNLTGSFAVTGPGGASVAYNQVFWETGNNGQCFQAFDPANATAVLCGLLTAAGDANLSRTVKPGAGVFVYVALDAYVTGSSERVKTAVFDSSLDVSTFYGVSWYPYVGNNGLEYQYVNGGFKTIFTAPATLSKPVGTKYTQKFKSTWARA
jgi:hypothetical protein